MGRAVTPCGKPCPRFTPVACYTGCCLPRRSVKIMPYPSSNSAVASETGIRVPTSLNERRVERYASMRFFRHVRAGVAAACFCVPLMWAAQQQQQPPTTPPPQPPTKPATPTNPFESVPPAQQQDQRSEEHTSELQSPMY